MATTKKDKNELVISTLKPQERTIFIEGESDLIINQMNARTIREMVAKQSGQKMPKQQPNVWEDIITSIRWRDPLPLTEDDGFKEYNEEWFKKILTENAPCISAFGLKKAFMNTVVRNEIDTYSTKFDTTVSVLPVNGGIPIEFATHTLGTFLLPPPSNRGTRVLARESIFSGWKTNFKIRFTDNVYSLDEIVSIINLSGFGIGIGSGRSAGYGRYKVVDVK